MSLIDKIGKDLNTALKARDEVAVSILRFLLSKVHNAKIAKGQELSDEEVMGEIAKEAKRHQESIQAYEKAARKELVDKEKAELSILGNYLPKQLTGEEIGKIVEGVIARTRASSMVDMGKVMGGVMAEVGGRADGAVVAQEVKKKLTSE